VNAQRSSGWHRIVWDGKDDGGKTAPSGVYVCSLNVNDTIISRKMIFMQ
jgi:flagellar hook assembly protein FlgD